MLLPSAFSCDAYGPHQPQRHQRPKLPSFGPYESSPSPRSGPVGLLSSCQALHSILGGPVQATRSYLMEPATIKPAHQPNPFVTRRRLQPPARIVTPPRGANKRRREEFEEDTVEDVADSERLAEERDAYQTPKRLRRIPLDMPMGLNTSDFDALDTEDLPPDTGTRIDGTLYKLESPVTLPTNTIQSSPKQQTDLRTVKRIEWSPDEDHQLVEAVLSKLNLSRRDWNDCAKQLGKDQDSLGRRWKMLVGKGNIGLRRGSGPMARVGLDVKSW